MSSGGPFERGPAVLQLLTRMNVGGPARMVLDLVKGLSTSLSMVVAAGSAEAFEGELRDLAVPVRPVSLVRPVRPTTDARALGQVRRLIRHERFAIVHTHMAKAGALGRIAALSLPASERPRLVHTFHGHVFEGYFGSVQREAFLRTERVLARRSNVLVAVSPEIRDELLDLGIGKPSQYRVIEIGIDLEAFLAVKGRSNRLRGALGLPAEMPLVGILGRLVPIKDHATLLEAIAGLPKVHLAVLGDGELRPVLEDQARRLRIADRVHFTGWWPDVPAALADLDLVVLSSRNEGTPMVLIEALAAGRPVVATDVGGVRHVVQDGVTGWLCPSGDAAMLTALIRQALENRQVATTLAGKGRRRMTERFDQRRMIANHVEVYRELLPRSTGPYPALTRARQVLSPGGSAESTTSL